MIRKNEIFWKSLSLIIVVTVVLIPIYCSHKRSQHFKNTILSNPILLTGEIIDIKRVSKRSDLFVFKLYNSKNYLFLEATSNSAMSKYRSTHQYLLGKSFPVITSKDEPQEFSQILICKDDFEKFNIPFPDSLRWVEKLRR